MSQLVSSLDGQTAMENDSFLIQSKCDDYQKLRLLVYYNVRWTVFCKLRQLFYHKERYGLLATPGNTITYHNALRLSPQNFV